MLSRQIEDGTFQDWLSSVGKVVQFKGKPQVVLNDLLGTGGNISTIDLAFTYLSCCAQLWPLEEGEPSADCRTFAEAAIAGRLHQGTLLKKGILCHLSPIADYYGELDTRTGELDYPDNGGSNQLANPVDYILAIEGLLQFSGTVGALKETDGESQEKTIARYPLLVEVNTGSAETSDRTPQSKHECWLPLWPEPMDLDAYRYLVLDDLNYRQANQIVDTLDLLSALANDSEALGFKRYARFGFWPRKGQGSYAIHVGMAIPGAGDLASELRSWRRKVRPRPDHANATYGLLLSLEQRLVALQQGQGSVLELLMLLGRVERHLSRLQSPYLPPVPRLSEHWVQAAYTQNPSTEFRLALALASTGLRSRISQARYSPKNDRFFWSQKTQKLVPTQSLATLTLTLLSDWARTLAHHPSKGFTVWAKPIDIAQLLQGNANESLMVDLACGLSLCRLPKQLNAPEPATPASGSTSHPERALPLAYRYAASLQWNPDLALSLQAIHALQRGETGPLLRQLRSQNIQAVLPATLHQSRSIASALAFPIKPFFWPQ